MAKQNATNRQMLLKLIKEANDIELALLRERIVLMMDITIRDIEKQPEKWANLPVHPNLYRHLCEKVKNIIGFNN